MFQYLVKIIVFYVFLIACALAFWKIFYFSLWQGNTENKGFLTGKSTAEEDYKPTKTLHHFHPQDKNTKKVKPRRNIIIISHGRSGSTIIGDIFNHHSSVFYLFEPLQTARRMEKQKLELGESYKTFMANFLTSIFRCEFNETIVADIQSYYRKHPTASIAVSSPPLCPFNVTDARWNTMSCPRLTRERLESACRINYEVTVIKILINRMEDSSIKNVLNACNPPDIDCKIIFLLRDPRAAIASSRSVGFFKNDRPGDSSKPELRRYSYEQCKRSEENLAFVLNLDSFWRERVMIQRYEDFASDPLVTLSKLYMFANLPEQEYVKAWLYRRTHHSNDHRKLECDGIHPALCTIDDAMIAINRWRLRVPVDDIVIIEQYCQVAMWMMGYKPIRGSQQLLTNISIPLFDTVIETETDRL